MVEEQRCPTPAIFYFFKNAAARKKGKNPDGSREGDGGDRMGETIAAGRLTCFHEVMD